LAISDLLTVPGASRCILEARVPYSASALSQFLGAAPEKFCSARTARAMAMASFWRAIELMQYVDEGWAQKIYTVWGLGATASLKTDRPKQGEHRFHVAVQTAAATETFSVQLQKEARTRLEEERLVADTIISAITSAIDVQLPLRVLLLPQERMERLRTAAAEDWRDVMLGDVDAAIVLEGSGAAESSHTSGVIFPGAFHPLHHGHRRIAEFLRERLHKSVEFEISVENVDKPPLDYTEISERLHQFASDDTVWLTRAPTFVEKAKLFPGATFIVGADTIQRIAEPRYYNTVGDRDAALNELARLDCRFIVFGRQTTAGFCTLSDLSLPTALVQMCDEVSAEEFREDVSSTQLRAKDASD